MNSIDVSDLTVLVVEPSSTQYKYLQSHLEQAGITKVDRTNSAEDTLNFVTRSCPDLIISSFYLPDQSATSLLESLRGREDTRHTPFILITSETNFKVLDPIRQAGIVALLTKPFTQQDLLRALHSATDLVDPSISSLHDTGLEDLVVLVVDDSSLARSHITRVLNTMGVEQITTANNGKEALEILSTKHFDLIVTDYNMPEMDGRELVETVRKGMGDSYTPILMVTSEENNARLSAVQQVGVSAICDKPFEPSSVRDILTRICAA